MAAVSLEVSGPDPVNVAAGLRAVLAAAAGPEESVSPVEVRRSAELVVAVVSLVFAGVDAAKTIWEWWHERRPDGATVTILMEDGVRVELSGVDQGELEIQFARHTEPGSSSR